VDTITIVVNGIIVQTGADSTRGHAAAQTRFRRFVHDNPHVTVIMTATDATGRVTLLRAHPERQKTVTLSESKLRLINLALAKLDATLQADPSFEPWTPLADLAATDPLASRPGTEATLTDLHAEVQDAYASLLEDERLAG